MTEKTPPAAAPAADQKIYEDKIAGLQRDNQKLREINANLRTQVAVAGPARTPGAQHVFQLSEADRQELEISGVVSIGGRLMSKDDVVKAMADAGQKGVTIADAPDETRTEVTADTPGMGPGVRGVDYVWPSVERGKIDPAVAGTPGISGPSAGAAAVEPVAAE